MDMHFSKTSRISEGLHHDSVSTSQHMFAKVVFIDKRDSQLNPQLFTLSPEMVLHQDNLLHLKQKFESGFHDESFIGYGDVNEIDRVNKQVKLGNGNIVSYEHMILVSNHDTSDKQPEFYGGVIALLEALRVQSQVPFGSAKCSPHLEKKTIQLSEEVISRVNSKLVKASSIAISQWYLGKNKRFYEVQI